MIKALKFHKIFIPVITLISMLFVSSMAFSGLTVNTGVITSEGYFSGSFGSSRNSANGIEYISCTFTGHDNLLVCGATDRNGVSKYCYTTDPDMTKTVSSMTDSSLVIIRFETTYSQCTSIRITNASYVEPRN